MACCCGVGGVEDDLVDDSEVEFVIPAVKRLAVQEEDKSSAIAYTRDNLPLGALLTGAQKLHKKKQWTGKGIRVGVIDSGIDQDHPGFTGMVQKQEWYRSGTPLSQDDHGTHVAGTIHFMAPDAELYDYRVFGARGKYSVSEAIRLAIRQAVEDGCHVINMSLGGPVPSRGIRDAVRYATQRGVLCVCAAGNEGDNNPLTNEISYPASYPECLSIAAVSKKDGFPVARFSNSNVEVDYAGIGVNVISLKPGGGYQSMSGTSMACPHVCGFIAAILSSPAASASAAPAAANVQEIRNRLTNNFTLDIGLPGRDTTTGLGFVSALQEDEIAHLFQLMGMTMKTKKKYEDQAQVY